MTPSSQATAIRRQHKPKIIPAELPKTGLVRSWVVRHFFPFSDEQLRRFIAAGKFPAPIKIGKRAIAWDAAKLHVYIDSLDREAA